MQLRNVLLLFLLILLQAVSAETREHQCGNQPEIVLFGNDPAAFPGVCETAERTIDFLETVGIYPLRSIRLQMVESSIASEGYDAYGSYDSRNDLIRLMSFRAIIDSGQPQMYDEPFDEIHYVGAIAHEVAHAVMQHNLMTELISPAPQEYLAHAAQLAVMPADRRQQVINRANVGPWEPGDAISDIYMAMQPARFAVKSYLHLMSLREPEAFVRILLNANWFYVYVPVETLKEGLQ